MTYDGLTKLQPEIAKIIGCPLTNQKKIARETKKAKLALGLDAKKKILNPDERVRVYSYLVELYSQSNNESVEIVSQPNNESVKIVSQDSDPEPLQNLPVELYSQPNNEPVEIVSQPTNNKAVELYSHTNNFDNVRIAFYTGMEASRKRQVIALDGFFINSLASIGISKQDVPQWLTKQVKDWTAFDAKLPVTRQVKYLIMREVVKGLGGNDDVFCAKL